MTDQPNTEAAAAEEAQGPQFSLQRIYVRDLSFEAPKSPAIFRQEWTPSVGLDLNTRQKQLEGDFHEVVLTLSVTVKNGEEVAFIAEVQQAGIFLIKNLDAASMSHLGALRVISPPHPSAPRTARNLPRSTSSFEPKQRQRRTCPRTARAPWQSRLQA